MAEKETELIKVNLNKTVRKFREMMPSEETNAFVLLAEKQAAIREAGGRKAGLSLESSRNIALTKQDKKEAAAKEEKEKKEEFQAKSELLLKTPTPEPIEEEEEEEEPAEEGDDEEFKRRVQEELEESFKLFDINGDGKISLHELMSVMASVGKEVSVEDAQEILEEIDEDGDGEISFKEFKAIMHEKMVQGTVEEDLKDAFDIFDHNKDGFISPLEIQMLFRKLGEIITPDEAIEIMSDCDLNQDGLIDFEEFKNFFQKMNEQHMKATKVEVEIEEPDDNVEQDKW